MANSWTMKHPRRSELQTPLSAGEGDWREGVIEELAEHIAAIEAGEAAPGEGSNQHRGGIFRDADTEKSVVKECRYVLGLLAHRSRSEAEVRAKLSERVCDVGVLDEVMRRLDAAGLIDDEAFARAWIEQRRAHKLLGTAALRRELEGKGVDSRDIDAVLDEAAPYDSEKERCQVLARERLAKELRKSGGAENLDRGAALRRIGGALARRGYSENLTLFVLNRELDAAGVTWS